MAARACVVMSRERSYDPVEVGGGDAERERGGAEAGAFVVGFVGLELRDTKLVRYLLSEELASRPAGIDAVTDAVIDR